MEIGSLSANTNTAKVWPNPFTDVINISDYTNTKTVTVSDIAGRIVKTVQNPGAQINLGFLSTGIYMLNLTATDGKQTVIKVVKQ